MTRLLAVLALLATASVPAQEPTSVARSQDRSVIDGRAGAGVQGMASINLSAGVSNVQANVRSIALGPDGAAVATSRQFVDATGSGSTRDAHAVLGGSAFDSAHGVLGLNQAAGSANAQVNLLAIGADAIAVFGQQIDNLALASVRVEPAAAGVATAPESAPVREARIEGAALGTPSGILQINQTAGAGNASANAIVLHLPGGTP